MLANETIFALSTASGRAGVAVMRVSGPLSKALIETLTGQPAPAPRYATLRALTYNNVPIDRGLILYFPAPHSFTGEDMAELQVHGGRAVVRALSDALEQLGAHPAEPGEFSKRAFLNGKLDLAQAEAIADLVDAETAAQAAQALAQADGALSRLYAGWRERLTGALAHVEASLDFPDEDLPADLLTPLRAAVATLRAEIDAHLADARRGERLRQGVSIAILGAPNAGKSSLINLLAQRDIAIVSARAGTTRDVIEAHLDLGGYPVILADTAGLRATADEIESEGIARARARATAADIKLLLFDATQPPDDTTLALADADSVIVLNKVDLLDSDTSPSWERSASDSETGEGVYGSLSQSPSPDHPSPRLRMVDLSHEREVKEISTTTGAGIAALIDAITTKVIALCGDLSRPAPTRERHRHNLALAYEALQRFETAPGSDLAAEDLRAALTALGRITGRVDVEDLLDLIFREFCIGK